MKLHHASPFDLFQQWYNEAKRAREPTLDAVALATASKSGKPSVRMVLFKEISEDGFVFYTNFRSRKGKELTENPWASLVFYWPKLERQVRLEGKVEKIIAEESDAYFRTRPRGSQIGAWASLQSDVLSSRVQLEKRYGRVRDRFEGRDIPRPSYWGGYRLQARTIEFWQGRENRLHERRRFKRKARTWRIELLHP
jgi:pyridoxamine 5'-phosphate oxidase